MFGFFEAINNLTPQTTRAKLEKSHVVERYLKDAKNKLSGGTGL